MKYPELAYHSEKLIYFYEIASHSNLQQAARNLGLTPPTLSHSLKELESHLKVQLFERHSKGLTLTSTGTQLFEFCQKYFHDLEMVQEGLSSEQLLKKRIRVGTFQSIALFLWPQIFTLFKTNEHYSLSLKTDRSSKILDLLLKNEIDVALTVGRVKHPNLLSRSLFEDHYTFVASRKLTKVELPVTSLKDLSLFYFPEANDDSGLTLKQFIAQHGLFFKESSEVESFEAISSFVAKNMGIGILPIQVAKLNSSQIRPLKIQGLPTKFGKHSFFLSYRKDLSLKQSVLDSLILSATKSVDQMITAED